MKRTYVAANSNAPLLRATIDFNHSKVEFEIRAGKWNVKRCMGAALLYAHHHHRNRIFYMPRPLECPEESRTFGPKMPTRRDDTIHNAPLGIFCSLPASVKTLGAGVTSQDLTNLRPT